jgi:hypothetical protein
MAEPVNTLQMVINIAMWNDGGIIRKLEKDANTIYIKFNTLEIYLALKF